MKVVMITAAAVAPKECQTPLHWESGKFTETEMKQKETSNNVEKRRSIYST